MSARSVMAVVCAALLAGCVAHDVQSPDGRFAPSFVAGGQDRPVVLVNPNVRGNGTAATIQQGVDLVAPGGQVLVLPGTYDENVEIHKGVTIEAIADGSGPVIIAPTDAPVAVIDIRTRDPVVIRDVTIHRTGTNGIRGLGPVDLTVERAVVLGISPVPSNLIAVIHDAADGTRARLVVRNSVIDAGVDGTPPIAQAFGLRPQGDVDALFEGNTIRRAGGACIFAVTRADLGGALNVDIVNNHIDACHPVGRVAGIIVGPVATNLPTETRPVTATGVVNIIGNIIENSTSSCLPASAVAFEVGSGRIEHNQIRDYVLPCAVPTGRNLQGALWAGRRQHPLFPPVQLVVRFNDIVGNAHAGVRVGANQSVVIDATCNYWGSDTGPSGVGAGTGDAVIAEAGGATPTFTPFATTPIAGTGATSCE